MSGLLTKAGYDPVNVESIEVGKVEAAKLPPGAVIVTAIRLPDGTAREFINWLNDEKYKFPVIAVVDNLKPMELIDVMCGWGAVNVIQRLAIDKQLVEKLDRYASSGNNVLILDNTLIPRTSDDFRNIKQAIER